MEIKHTMVLDSSDSLSKALPELDMSPAVIVTKNGRYFGIIDHRSLSPGMKDPHNTKCETATSKPPVLLQNTGIMDRVDAFLLGHFKALPVVDEGQTPIGITTRVELIKEMIVESLIPKMQVDELMGSPVYVIDEGESIGTLKRMLKEKKAHRFVVMGKGNMVGVVSSYDIGAWAAKPNLMASGRKDKKPGEPINVDSMPISSFLRPDISIVKEGTGLDEAARRMVKKQVSAVIVVSGNKPVGVLSALDIFKKVQEVSRDDLEMAISGLSGDDSRHYTHIKSKIGHVLEKFGKSFNIRNCSVHVKKGKSTYVVNIYFDIDRGHVSLKGERASLKETVDELSVELSNVLRKRKELRRPKPRVTHAH
jgi:CBS domain-containing protein/ribosome-associated translation inhibitor RaiA